VRKRELIPATPRPQAGQPNPFAMVVGSDKGNPEAEV
jgi:hypothetical protein